MGRDEGRGGVAVQPAEESRSGAQRAVGRRRTRCPSDGLALYLGSDRLGAHEGDLWAARRSRTPDSFGPPARLARPVDSAFGQDHAATSADGLSLYFASGRPGGVGDWDLWMATRPSPSAPFGPPVNLGRAVNSTAYDGEPSISDDGLVLVFASDRAGGLGRRDLWVATRATTAEPFGRPVNLGRPVNTPGFEATPDLASDGGTLYFLSDRRGGSGFMDLWQAKRATG